MLLRLIGSGLCLGVVLITYRLSAEPIANSQSIAATDTVEAEGATPATATAPAPQLAKVLAAPPSHTAKEGTLTAEDSKVKQAEFPFCSKIVTDDREHPYLFVQANTQIAPDDLLDPTRPPTEVCSYDYVLNDGVVPTFNGYQLKDRATLLRIIGGIPKGVLWHSPGMTRQELRQARSH